MNSSQLRYHKSDPESPTNVQQQKSVITVPYDEMKKQIPLDSTKINKINTRFPKDPLPIKTFVEMAQLQDVVATVSIPSDNSQISITEIKIGNIQIYPPTQGGSKPRGGRKSRVSSRRGGGRKSRRRHNYI